MNKANVPRLLILGGTADAVRVAKALCSQPGYGSASKDEQPIAITYSVAGLVRKPTLSCHVISGGFSQFGGLSAYMADQQIDAVLDMTHPYAQGISQAANEAAAECAIPCWRFHRRAWQPEQGDDWHECENWEVALAQLDNKQSVFLTAGHLPLQALTSLLSLYGSSDKTWVLRTAVEPSHPLPAGMHWIKAIGPFSEKDELALMQKYDIDAVVSKNSGGKATSAKLRVARNLGIPVYMMTRPSVTPADRVFTNVSQCEQYVSHYFRNTALPCLDETASGSYMA